MSQRVTVFVAKGVLGHVKRHFGLPPASAISYLNQRAPQLALYHDTRRPGEYVAVSPDGAHAFFMRHPREPFASDGVDYVATCFNPAWAQYESSTPAAVDVTWV